MTLRFLLFAVTLAPAAGRADPETLPLTLATRASWVENHSRTSDAATLKDAADYELSASTDLHRQFSPGWQFSGEASAAWTTVPKFDALDAWRLGGRGELRHKFGLGPMAPVLDLHGALTRAWCEEDGRSGLQVQAGATLRKRFTSTWRGAVGAEWSQFFARGEPFDVRQDRFFVSTSWDVTDRWQVEAGAARIDGQLTANAAWAVYGTALAGGFGPAIQSYYSAIPWHVTDTYGPGWVAYRVDARADQWWVGVAPALGESTSLPFRYERVEVTNRVGVKYVSEFWSLGLVHRF